MRKGDRSVDAYVHKLRDKLDGALAGWRYIHTHLGFGYRPAEEPAPPASTTDAANVRSPGFHSNATEC